MEDGTEELVFNCIGRHMRFSMDSIEQEYEIKTRLRQRLFLTHISGDDLVLFLFKC
jgi:hypothetical protein